MGRQFDSIAETPQIVHLPDLPGVPCPCGVARRAFENNDAFPGTVHLTEIAESARPHYHSQHTEVYVILECEPNAQIELDGVLHSVTPLTSILIPKGTKHRAVGKMKALIVSTPNFDPDDEHFD